jgi:TRAP-type mannitol/chloroaromatic compound transport system substrate-binding protein
MLSRRSLPALLTLTLVCCLVSFSTCLLAAEEIKWKLVCSYPGAGTMWDNVAVRFAEHVKMLSGGRLIIEPTTTDTPLKVSEMVKNGTFPIGSTWSGYEIASDPTSVLFGGVPGGLSDEQYLCWFYNAGGEKLLQEWRKEKSNLVSFPLGLGSTEVIHSHKPIRTIEDFKGLKMRTAGVWAEILPKFGGATVTLPPTDIQPAFEKQLVDVVEWADPATNLPWGFHKIAKYVLVPGVHQPCNPGELVINHDAWEKLPADLKKIVQAAAKLTTYESWTSILNESDKAMIEFQKSGAEIIVFSEEVRKKAADLGNEWAAQKAEKNPWFKKVYDSQTAFKAGWDQAKYIRIK